ncbi:unnamed protein product [Blepharisma stoltei]|uniref:Uncharacterized protein n=1 Tax=Blepharisma stoltei TaxID=1481888 RepID=A0AAU9JH70_9CILI|nr:unnamed protein product [Blepharisma stoltei]
MVSTKTKILIKLSLDTLYFIFALTVCFTDVFKFMKNYYIGMINLTTQTTTYSITVEATGTFQEFKDHWCNKKYLPDKICDNIDDFKTGGILFVVFSALAHLFWLYSVASLILKSCMQNFTLALIHDVENFIYPAIYALSVVLYIFVSKIYSVSPPKYYDDDYEVKTQEAEVFMYIALCFGVLSGLLFLFCRTEINENCKVGGSKNAYLMG